MIQMNGTTSPRSPGWSLKLCNLKETDLSRRTLGYSNQALYCYGKVYSLDSTNVDALWDRAILAKEIGQLKTVRE